MSGEVLVLLAVVAPLTVVPAYLLAGSRLSVGTKRIVGAIVCLAAGVFGADLAVAYRSAAGWSGLILACLLGGGPAGLVGIAWWEGPSARGLRLRR